MLESGEVFAVAKAFGFAAFFAVNAFLVSYLLACRLLAPSSRLFILDHPNERSLHDQPTPRGGGIAIAAGIFLGGVAVGIAYGQDRSLSWLALGAGIILVVSFLDDRFEVPPFFRLAVHFLAAVLLAYHGFSMNAFELPGVRWVLAPSVGLMLSSLFLVWLVNLYNFMDGMDGFAAGMAVIGFGTFAVLGGFAGSDSFTTLSLVIAAAAGGFLLVNFPPARIFMGDVGSSLLGLFAAALSLWANREGIFPLWVGILVFSPFIVDATVTLLRRAVAGERVWQAHKTHFYQRLVQLGWGHRRTVLWEYALMVACGLSAILVHDVAPTLQWLTLGGWMLVYLGLIRLVGWLESPKHPVSQQPRG